MSVVQARCPFKVLNRRRRCLSLERQDLLEGLQAQPKVRRAHQPVGLPTLEQSEEARFPAASRPLPRQYSSESEDGAGGSASSQEVHRNTLPAYANRSHGNDGASQVSQTQRPAFWLHWAWKGDELTGGSEVMLTLGAVCVAMQPVRRVNGRQINARPERAESLIPVR